MAPQIPTHSTQCLNADHVTLQPCRASVRYRNVTTVMLKPRHGQTLRTNHYPAALRPLRVGLAWRLRQDRHFDQRMSASTRTSLWKAVLRTQFDEELHLHGLALPAATPPTDRLCWSLNLTLKPTISEFVRRTRIALPELAELVRGHTKADYSPNKSIPPAVLADTCRGYQHLDRLLKIAHEGVRVKLATPVPVLEAATTQPRIRTGASKRSPQEHPRGAGHESVHRCRP